VERRRVSIFEILFLGSLLGIQNILVIRMRVSSNSANHLESLQKIIFAGSLVMIYSLSPQL
jgi:hypothetical protein